MRLSFTESTARIAGQLAAREAIADYADRDAMRARRSARIQRKRIARANGKRK